MTAKGMLSILVLLGLAWMPNALPGKKTRDQCRALEAKMRDIHARMRQPYSARQGEKYNEKLRRLRREWAEHCR